MEFVIEYFPTIIHNCELKTENSALWKENIESVVIITYEI